MRIKTILFSAFLISGVAAGCSVDDTAPEPQDEAASERGRKKLGKADNMGSCIYMADTTDGGQVEKNYCGGKSWGSCWCDDTCADYGDCCEDKKDSCAAPPPPPPPPQNDCADGEKDCGGCCGKSFCVDEDQVCPMIMCPAFCPPPKCEETGSQCVQGPGGLNVCATAGLSDGIGYCDAPSTMCCGGPLQPPPFPVLSCEGYCGGPIADQACFCDDACSGYGDCCSDYQDVCQ